MKKLFTILSALFVLGMVFTSCGKSDNNGNDPFETPVDKKDHSFDMVKLDFKIAYSDDFLNLANVTCIFTDMKGEVKEIKLEPGKGELEILDVASTLPASSTFEVKIEKSENFDTYLASMDKFEFFFTSLPMNTAGWFEKCGDGHVLESSPISYMDAGYNSAEELKENFDDLIQEMCFTYTGTFQNSGNNITFKGTVK